MKVLILHPKRAVFRDVWSLDELHMGKYLTLV